MNTLNTTQSIIRSLKKSLQTEELPSVTTSLKAYFSLNNTKIESISKTLSSAILTYNTYNNRTGVICNGLAYSSTATNFIQNFNINTFSLTASSGVSVSLWVYANASSLTTSTSRCLFELDMPSDTNWLGLGYAIAIRSNGFSCWVANYLSSPTTGGYACSADTTSLTINTEIWYHIVMTFSSTNKIKFYINNSLTPMTSLSQSDKNINALNISTVNNRFYIGSSVQLTNSFNGIISKVGIYNKELSSVEIASLFNAG